MRISDWSSDVCSSDLFRKRLSNVEHGIKILPHFIAQHHQNLIAKAHANLALTIAWRASATLIDDELRCAKGGAGTGNPARVWLGTIGFRGAVAHVQAFGLKAAAHDSCMLPAPAAPAPSAREFGSYRIHPVSRVASGCEGEDDEIGRAHV